MNTDEASPVKSNKSVERGGEERVRAQPVLPATSPALPRTLPPASGQGPARSWLRVCHTVLRDLVMKRKARGSGAGAQPLPFP